MTLYVVAGVELPVPLPDHDVAIVIASDSEECRDALRMIDQAAARWPRPLLNPPRRVANLDRDKLHQSASRDRRARYSRNRIRDARAIVGCVASDLRHCAISRQNLRFPLIVRPRGSHAGVGLAKIDDARRDRALSRRTTGAGILRLAASSITPVTTACFANIGSCSSMAGHMLATWRSPIAGISGISTRTWPSAQASGSKKRRFMRDFDIGFARSPSSGAGGNGGADRPRLFHGRLRGKQARRNC